MEHTLRVRTLLLCLSSTSCLNPCFSGTYSQRSHEVHDRANSLCLNPCFSGTYSQSVSKGSESWIVNVLILVLVEHTLRGLVSLANDRGETVLILVLVEHTLRDKKFLLRSS